MSSRARFRRVAGWPWRYAQTLTCRLLFARGLVSTDGRVELARLGLDAPDRVEYAPSGWLFARRMLRGSAITPADVFADVGSGQGRMVYMVARHYPFGRVIGIELAPELSSVAHENIERTRHQLRCPNVELVTMDAAEWPVPDDLSYVYLYNPFVGQTFARVMANICASLDRRPRMLTLLYANPVEHDTVLATGRFQHVRTTRGIRRDIPLYRIEVFRTLA